MTDYQYTHTTYSRQNDEKTWNEIETISYAQTNEEATGALDWIAGRKRRRDSKGRVWVIKISHHKNGTIVVTQIDPKSAKQNWIDTGLKMITTYKPIPVA